MHRLLLGCGFLSILATVAQCQTLPSGVLNAPPLVIGDGESIGSNTTLNVAVGGVVGSNFEAGAYNGSDTNIEVNITGGSMGQNFEANSGSTINVSDGSIAWYMKALNGSVVNLTGGTISSYFHIYSGSEVNINGGSTGKIVQYGGETTITSGSIGGYSDIWGGVLNVAGGETGYSTSIGSFAVVNVTAGELGWRTRALNNSTINLFGGRIDTAYSAFNDSVTNIMGGTVGGSFYASGGSEVNLLGGGYEGGFETRPTADVRINGGEFRINGMPLAGIEVPGDSLQYDIPADAVLSGILANGTPFAFSPLDGDSIAEGSLTLVAAEFPTGPSEINVPADTAPQGVQAGQTMNVGAGGTAPSNFVAGWGSTVNVDGGEVGANFEAVGAAVNIADGVIQGGFDFFHDSVVAISGGQLGLNGYLLHSQLDVTGGVIGSTLTLGEGVTATLAGGTIDDRMRVDAGSVVTLVGGEFRVDGLPIAGLDIEGDTVAFDIPPSAVLSGTHADGTPFAFSSWDGDLFPEGVITLRAESLPQVGPTSIDASTDPLPLGIRDGQTMTVGPGAVVPFAFNAGRGSRVDVAGGEVGNKLEAVAAEVNISSGTVGDLLDAYDGTTLTMTGGELGYGAHVDNGSVFHLSGGISRGVSASRGAVINVVGGEINSSTALYSGSAMTLSGGILDRVTVQDATVEVSGGVVRGSFSAGTGSNVTLRGGRFSDGFSTTSSGAVLTQGGEFYLDGVAIEGISTPGDSLTINVPLGSVISGTLTDGTTFAFGKAFRNDSDSFLDGTLSLEFVEPAAISSSVITVPTDAAPLGVRDGQTLIVAAGGVVSDNVTAGVGSHVEVQEGGVIGANFEAVGANVLVEGGAIGSRLDVFTGATLTMTGGVLGFDASSAGSVNVFGGTLNLHGGTVEPALIASDGANVNLFGYGFAINGVPIEGLVEEEAFTILERGSPRLTGYLADGSLFDFDLRESSGRIADAFSADSLLTVTLVAEVTMGGDFNADGIVDGQDLLLWQRGETPYPMSLADLGLWKAGYGNQGDFSTIVSVPEPATFSFALAVGLIGIASNGCRLVRR